MFSTRVPKVYKELWIKHIFPAMDEKSLLRFSAVSHEARQAAFSELFKRECFRIRINNLISSASIVDKNHYEYLRHRAYFGETNGLLAVRLLQMVSGLMTCLAIWFVIQGEESFDPVETFSWAALDLIATTLMFHEGNKSATEKWQRELAAVARSEERSEKLSYLRDKLPKESIRHHTLFRQFIDDYSKQEPQLYADYGSSFSRV